MTERRHPEPVANAIAERSFSALGFRSRVLESGAACNPNGEAVVLIHGAPGSADDWRPLLPKIGGFARALAFDLPGFGLADRPAHWGYSPDALATFVAGTLDELCIDAPTSC